jgi:hypothetical protein
MAWSILCTGPYLQAMDEYLRPQPSSTSTPAKPSYIFKLPLGLDGAMPFIDLEDIGKYAVWLFTHRSEATGLDLEVGTCHASGADIAAAFTAATGWECVYEAADLEEFLDEFFKNFPRGKNTLIGPDADGMTWGENFRGWWTVYQACGGNKGLIQRDYEMLDRILPGRLRSVEEWMRKTGYKGEKKMVLKDSADKSFLL